MTRIVAAGALLLLGLLQASLSGCAWLDEKQRAWALRPTPATVSDVAVQDAALRPGDQRYLLPVPGSAGAQEQVALWWLPHADVNAPTLLYLHGTFRNLTRNLPKIEALRTAGFAVLAVDYRGWGQSTPIVPSEESITADAALAWAELVRRAPDAGRRVIFGHSMGGAVAVALASTLHHGSDYGALVLESTFTRMPDVASASGFWGGVMASITTLEFDSLSRIARVDAPLLMLHGDADKTVPVQLGRALRDAAPAASGVRWVEVSGGSHSGLHRDAPEMYAASLRALIQRLPPPQAATPSPPARGTP
jgi:pimeloyl-ACP methyl ester carboxylesterase